MREKESNQIYYDNLGLKFYYVEKFFSEEEASHIFQYLCKKIKWHQEQIKIFGKNIKLPRLTAYFSDEGKDYSYSGLKHESIFFPKILNNIRKKVESSFNKKFNSVLLNRYRDGCDWHGFHSDDEKILGDSIDICSVSFGAERDFIFKSKTGKIKKTINLKNGSALHMIHPTQINYTHSLPKRTKVYGERINLTFRYIN